MLYQKQPVVTSRRCLLLAVSFLVGVVAGHSPAPVLAQATSPVTKINEAAAKADITVERLHRYVDAGRGEAFKKYAGQ